MNREIKFRCWVEKDELSVFAIEKSYMVTQGEPDVETFQSFMFHYADEPILMQFTGLKDVNGKEIYEGDILKKSSKSKLFTGRRPRQKIIGSVKKVVFHEASFKLVKGLVSKKYILQSAIIYYYGFEVVGNIYEHPQLLTPRQGE